MQALAVTIIMVQRSPESESGCESYDPNTNLMQMGLICAVGPGTIAVGASLLTVAVGL